MGETIHVLTIQILFLLARTVTSEDNIVIVIVIHSSNKMYH